jgi:hypothetical protein
VFFYEELDYERALEHLQNARRLARTPEQEVTVSLHEGIVLGDMGQQEQSRAAFKKALFLSPEAKLPLKVSPKLADDFELARAEVRAEQQDSAAATLPLSAAAAPAQHATPSQAPPPTSPTVADPGPLTPTAADIAHGAPQVESALGPEAKPARDLWHTLDVGAALGFNSPSGIFGLELEYRPSEYLGVNLGGGIGAWGMRASPTLRLYPLGIGGASPFMEGGLSLNLGKEQFTVSQGNYRLLLTPVATLSGGFRFNSSRIFFSPRAGWSWRLRSDNYESADGTEISSSAQSDLGIYQHGGFLFSLTTGVTFL